MIFVLKTRAKLQVSVLGVSNCFEEISCKLQHQRNAKACFGLKERTMLKLFAWAGIQL